MSKTIQEIIEKLDQERLLRIKKEQEYIKLQIERSEKQRKYYLKNMKMYEKSLISVPSTSNNSAGGRSIINNTCGSLYFNDINKYLVYSISDSLIIGSNDYTIEWFQFLEYFSGWPRLFQFGNYDTSLEFGITIEGNTTMYFWENSSPYGSEISSPYYNWEHYVICRDSEGTRLYRNGINIFSSTYSYTLNLTKDLWIGQEDDINGNYFDSTYFSGYISQFHYVNGECLYTGDSIVVPSGIITKTRNTSLLLNSIDESTYLFDSSSNSMVPSYSGVSWSPINPFSQNPPWPIAPELPPEEED